MRSPRSSEDSREALQQAIENLVDFSEMYDEGEEERAARLLSTTLRLLLHDTDRCTSLLTLLRLKDALPFLNTANDPLPGNLLGEPRLCLIEAVPSYGAHYVPRLDDGRNSSRPQLPFLDWWNMGVATDDEGRHFCRRELITVMCNQDGGAHFDPGVDADYLALKTASKRLFEWIPSGEEPKSVLPVMGNIVWPSVRQMAHEVIRTLQLYSPKAPYHPRCKELSRFTERLPGSSGTLAIILEGVRLETGRPHHATASLSGHGIEGRLEVQDFDEDGRLLHEQFSDWTSQEG